MELRNGALVGGSRGVMPKDLRSAFEAGLVRVFERWTALGLAVENCFGGGDSVRKADLLIDDALQWFYSNKGAAYTKPCVKPIRGLNPCTSASSSLFPPRLPPAELVL